MRELWDAAASRALFLEAGVRLGGELSESFQADYKHVDYDCGR